MFYTEYFTLFPQFLQISIADNVLNVVPSFEPHNYNRFFERYQLFLNFQKPTSQQFLVGQENFMNTILTIKNDEVCK